MARPRKASDEEILRAAHRVMQRLGPAQWTLGDVAAEAGLTPGALVQRFGSKRTLQITLIARFADAGPAMHAALRAAHRSPLAALHAYADRLACLAASPGELAHHLDYLRLDLTDPDMHAHFRRHAETARAFLERLLREAVDARELRAGTDVAALTRLVEAALTGSLFTWATYQDGTASEWIRRSLRDLLQPHLPSPARRRQRRPPRARAARR